MKQLQQMPDAVPAPKAIFFDIDGTLYSHAAGHVPDSTFRAFELLKQQGILRIIATGRSHFELDVLPIEQLEPDALIVLNGMLAVDDNGQTEISQVLSPERTQELVEVFEEGEFSIALVERDRMYVNRVDPEAQRTQQAVGLEMPPVGHWTGNDVYMGVGFVNAEQRRQLERRLPHFHITAWNDYGVDIYPDTAGKAAAILEWADLHGFTSEELAAFGDGENDREMLAEVGVGIAMGNAKDAVKGMADLVCPDIDEDGLYRILCDLHWIEDDPS